MNLDQRPENQEHHQEEEEEEEDSIRDIYALTPPHPPPQNPRTQRSSALSVSSSDGISGELLFSTMSREFNALVLAGSTISNNSGSENNGSNNNNNNNNNNNSNLGSIGEDEMHEETNPLAIVADNHPLGPLPASSSGGASEGSIASSSRGGLTMTSSNHSGISVQRVKKEEVETKIAAWQNAKIAKVNNRFKREDAIINGWENEQVQKSTSWMKKVERKLEEKRAKALEKMQNDIAKAHRKAEERRASAEAKRGTKVARVFEIANLMRAVGRPPSKRSFF